jgi:hypothetical protein
VGGGDHFGAGVGGGGGEAGGFEQGQIDDVVAHAAGLLHAAAGLFPDRVQRLELAVGALHDEVHAQVAGAQGERARAALGDDAGFEAGAAGEADADAVVGAKALDLDDALGGGAVGHVPEGAVGEDAVDVEQHQLDGAGARDGVGLDHG